MKNRNLEGPIFLSLVFRLPRPKHHFETAKNSRKLKDSAPNRHTKKPDLNNLEMGLNDALNAIEAWGDNCQVCSVQKTKIYVEGLELHYPR
ncbi:RusA family crossover junction endodeoxyribonuclease [Terrimicrobium sacchariphilum]